jgi:glycosyltransferase involved in cell wall biosynthesis
MDENSAPFFSIITPSYNRASFLSSTIQSVIKQTFKVWEYIIVDDASSDNTKVVIDTFNDKRIIYLKNDSNSERGFSRNRGIGIARGKYICFLDSDDEYLENHLQVLYQNIQSGNEPVCLLYTQCFQKVNNGNTEERIYFKFDDQSKFDYILKYTFNPTRVCLHKAILSEYKFDENIPGLEDLDLWLHIAIKYPIFQINEKTVIYNIHEGTYTAGDYERYTKELKNFKYIFNKDEFKGLFRRKAKNRLLSMCHFHLSLRYEKEMKYSKMYNAIIKSFILCPEGYNLMTNKILLVMFIYHIPLFGNIFRKIFRIFKIK